MRPRSVRRLVALCRFSCLNCMGGPTIGPRSVPSNKTEYLCRSVCTCSRSPALKCDRFTVSIHHSTDGFSGSSTIEMESTDDATATTIFRGKILGWFTKFAILMSTVPSGVSTIPLETTADPSFLLGDGRSYDRPQRDVLHRTTVSDVGGK
jgi:hypothetical protein